MSSMTTGSPRRHRLTAAEYRHMGEAGVLRPDARVELIEGELIDMAPIGSRHAATVERLDDLLVQALAGRAMVRMQHPVVLDDHSVTQPDIAVVVRRDDYYTDSHPQPSDVLLLVEIADTTLVYDRDVKAPLYARSGMPELWIVDLVGRRVTRFSSPRDGVYTESVSARAGEFIGIGAFPDVRIDSSAILPG
jgi:Uma2 family endonuclease